MTRRQWFARGVLLASLALAIQACSTVPAAAVPASLRYDERAEALASVPGWMLKGRLAVRDDRDGGSGTLQWRQGPESGRMDFHGALGRGAWRLETDPAGAQLELADGSRYQAPTVNELLEVQLGWTVPVDALAWWVRGLQAPGDVSRRVLSADGTIELLSQNDWTIEYGRYREVDGVALPLKLTATRGERRVKLAVRDWVLEPADD